MRSPFFLRELVDKASDVLLVCAFFAAQAALATGQLGPWLN